MLNALVTLNTNTSYHFKIHVYTVLKNIPPNAPTFFIQEEANFIDPIAHRIYLTDYPEAPNNDPQHFWSYFPFLPGVIAFRNSNPSGTLITPLLNNDGNGNPEGLFDWLNDATHPEQSLYKSEKIFLDDAIQNHIADIGNSIITEGSFQWFKYTPAKQASSNSQNNQYCTNNELFYINGATNYCPGIPTVTICNPLTLSYIGNYETGVTCDWTFGDGNGISGALPEDQTHTYHALGTYTISCHVKFPPSAISPSQTCDYEFHRDVTIIGAAVNAGLDQTICSSNIVPLQGSYSGAASSATWSTNGTGTFNNISSPTATYIASSADIANGEVLLTFTTNNPSGACGAVNDDVKITFATSPSISFSPSNPSICFGNSVGLNANGASSFLWSPSSGLSCTTCSSPTANPTVTTTYTVIGTSNDCSSTATITVIVIPSVSVSPTSPLAFCTGGSGITLTASNATSYSWIPANGLNCTTCSVVNANPSVTTTYTVVGTGTNGCTNSSTSVVTILANPPVSITPGGAPCIGTQLCTNTGFTSYSWLPNHETTSCIPTSAPISIYSVTVTNANGCTSSASASLTLSCCGGGTLLNQSSFNANIIPAGTYNLNSNILLSHSVTLDGCIITIGAGYSITVPNQYTLTVQNGAELSACGNMWRGIIVNGGGTFTSLPTGANCKIKDAQYAVEVKDNGTINIDKCDFINDYIGVNLYDLGAAGPIHINGYIKNSSFSTIGSLKAVNPSGVPNNFQYTHSFAGIRAYNVSLFNVGVNNGTSVNQFIDLNFGIHSTNSNLGVTDYRFRRIKKYDLPPIDTSALRNYGSAVFTTGNPTANYLTMTGRKITTDPDFQECHYAVNSSNSNINIKVNKIDNCDFGIYVSQGNSLIINAINNYIDCNTYGVSLIAVDRFSHSAIYSNIIYGGQRQTDVNGIPTLATGINVAGFNHINTNTHIIQNSIHLFDYGFAGIELNAIKSSFVSFNYITLHNSVNNTMKGISLSGSQENTISCNSVNGTVSGQINYSTDETGYDIFDSQSNDIRCNAATQTSNGYRFSGTCNGGLQSTTLTSNDIGSHYNGLIYTFSALVDPQINQGNWWYQTTYPGFAATNLNPSQLAVANERYDVYANLLSGQNLPIPSEINVVALVPWFTTVPTTDVDCGLNGSHHSNCNILTEPPPGGGGGIKPIDINPVDEAVASGEINSSSYNEETQWKSQVALYEKLLKMPDYKDEHPVLTDFFENQEGTTVEQVATINVESDEVTLAQETMLETIENNANSIYQMADTIRICDSTLSIANLDVTEIMEVSQIRSTTINQLNQLITSNHQQFAALENVISDNADQLNIQNEDISSSEVYEHNEQIINDVYLNGIVAKNPDYFNLNSSSIFTIAQQCPLAGGPAVFRARTLYKLIDPNIHYNDDVVCLQSGRQLRLASKNQIPVGIFPNPASTEVTITYTINSDQTLQFIDNIGRISMEILLNPKENRITKNISQLSEGIYSLRLTGKDNIQNNISRLTIIK